MEKPRLATLVVSMVFISSLNGSCTSLPPASPVEDFIEILDLTTGERVSMPYSADGSNQEELAMIDDENERFFTLRRYESQDSIREISYDGHMLRETNADDMWGGILSRDGRFVAKHNYSSKGGVRVFDASERVLRDLFPEVHMGSAAWWTHDNHLLVADLSDEHFRLLQLDPENETLEVVHEDRSIRSRSYCTLSPNGRMLAICSGDNLIILDLESGGIYPAGRGVGPGTDSRELQWSPDSAYVALHSPGDALITIHSVPLQKDLVSKSTMELRGAVVNLYFLKASQLALEVTEIDLGFAPSGLTIRELVTLDIENGTFSKPLPWKISGAGHPIAGGTKLLCFADDDRDY